MMTYDFLAPGRIVFGWGRRKELAALARPLGNRAFLVTGSRRLEQDGTIQTIEASLHTNGIEPITVATARREPEVEDVDNALRELRELGPKSGDLVIGIGGGSALDLAKAVAALATQPAASTVLDYLEGVGTGAKLVAPPLPMIALPTTAGTGTEVTKNAVISSTQGRFKKSLRSDAMVPRIALIDPELTVSVPAAITAATGMDAITQLIEAYLSRRAQPIPRALCLQGLELAIPAVVEAVENGASREAREKMAHAALLSGLALANSGLGMAHGVAAALGVHCGISHGLACAVMLPVAVRCNASVARADILRLSPLITGRIWKPDDAAISATIEHLEELNRRVKVPANLSALGVTREQIPELVQASRGNSMSGNPRELSDPELTRILEQML